MHSNKKEKIKNIDYFIIVALKNRTLICFGKFVFLDLFFSYRVFYVSPSKIYFKELNKKVVLKLDLFITKEIYHKVQNYKNKLNKILKNKQRLIEIKVSKDNDLIFTNDYIVLIKNDAENKIKTYKLIKVLNSQLVDLIKYKELFNKTKLFNDENDYNLIYLRNCFLDSFLLKNLVVFDIDNLIKVILDIFRNIKVRNDEETLQFLERNDQTDKEYIVKNFDIDLLKKSNFKFLHRPLIALIDASPLLKTINFYRRTVLNVGNRNGKVYDFNKLVKEIYKI